MQFILLAKALKALGLFIREIWLRDRTFRQFVRDNLSLIVTSFGFIAMTVMFTHVYVIVKDQEVLLARAEREQTRLQTKIDGHDIALEEARERTDWYKARYLEYKDKVDNPPVMAVAEIAPAVPKPRPRPKQPVNNPQAVIRTPGPDIVERWKKLSQQD